MRRYSFEGTIASILFIALFGIILVQVLGRTPVLTGPVWTEEAARWLWVWMAFVAIAEAERTDTQLRMGFLADLLPRGIRRVLFTLIDLVYLGIVGHLSWIGYKTVMRTANNISVTLPTTDAVLYGSAFVAFLLVLHRILRRIFERFGKTIEVTP
ncbi:MAG: TRAP transporter small permease [Flavimaricola sp.]|nr:TRAP transporter small permease [Flavimaricola sp.]